MDRRFEDRYQTNMDVTVTDIETPDQVATGQILNISKFGVCADLSLRFTVGASIKARVDDHTLFGHIAYCDGNHTFRTGIEVAQVLMGESDLSRLINAVRLEDQGITVNSE
jgi:hypothetical protein